jgi:copper(I)-binding protein
MVAWLVALALLSNILAGALAAILIGSGKDVDLKRDGPHLELTGFKKPLDAYESFAMTLVFEKAGSVVVEVMVEEAEAEPKPQ